jgi:hypothetical protein
MATVVHFFLEGRLLAQKSYHLLIFNYLTFIVLSNTNSIAYVV